MGNLSFDTTEESLRALFEDNGATIEEVRIITRDGLSRGYSYIPFSYIFVYVQYTIYTYTCRGPRKAGIVFVLHVIIV